MTETIQRHKRGGLYFEDFEVGKLYEHRYTRTVTQMDNMLFSNMTLNPQPLHIDRHFCESDTVNCSTQVVSKRASKSRPGAGIVEFHHQAFKQDGTLVAECHRQAFIIMRPK